MSPSSMSSTHTRTRRPSRLTVASPASASSRMLAWKATRFLAGRYARTRTTFGALLSPPCPIASTICKSKSGSTVGDESTSNASPDSYS